MRYVITRFIRRPLLARGIRLRGVVFSSFQQSWSNGISVQQSWSSGILAYLPVPPLLVPPPHGPGPAGLPPRGEFPGSWEVLAAQDPLLLAQDPLLLAPDPFLAAPDPLLATMDSILAAQDPCLAGQDPAIELSRTPPGTSKINEIQ